MDNNTPSLYATVYAMRIVTSSGSDPLPRLTLTSAEAGALTMQARDFGPVFGSYYLYALGVWARDASLVQQALSQLSATLTPHGYFSDVTGAPSASLPVQLAETSAALEMLSAQKKFRPTSYLAVASWLSTLGPRVALNPFLAMEWAKDTRALGGDVTRAALASATTWLHKEAASIASATTVSTDDVYRAFASLEIFRMANRRASPADTVVFMKCAEAAVQSNDLQVVSMGAALSQALRLTTLERSYHRLIAPLKLPSGLYADPTVVNGTLASTFYVATSQFFAPSSEEADKLYAASVRATDLDVGSSDRSACVIEVALAVALNHPHVPNAIQQCAAASESSIAPRVVDAATAPEWFSIAVYLASNSSGRDLLAHVTVVPWTATGGLSAVEAVRAAYVALQDAPSVPSLASKFRWASTAAEELLRQGPGPFGSTYYFEAAYDLLSLGVPLSHVQRTELTKVLTTDKGCPAYPQLYREALATGANCSLETSAAADSLAAFNQSGAAR